MILLINFEKLKRITNALKVKDIFMHIGTNHLPRDHPDELACKTFWVLNFMNRGFQLATIYLSGILPKYESYDGNSQVFNMCYNHEHLNFNQHQAFAVNLEINFKLSV